MKALYILLLLPALALGAPEDMVVRYYGEPGCEITTVTNWFELRQGESVTLTVNTTQCTNETMQFLFFGNHAKRNSGKQFTHSSGMLLCVYSPEPDGDTCSTAGNVLITTGRTLLTLTAVNLRKDKRIRLRGQIINE